MPKFPKNTSAFKMKNSPYKLFGQNKQKGFLKKLMPLVATVGATLLAGKLLKK